jgi:3-methyladenine DNA glycosylase AlkC
MMSNSEFEVFHLIYQNQSNVIKVIGRWSNAINHMFKKELKEDFIVCILILRLQSSSVPKKQLGELN